MYRGLGFFFFIGVFRGWGKGAEGSSPTRFRV